MGSASRCPRSQLRSFSYLKSGDDVVDRSELSDERWRLLDGGGEASGNHWTTNLQ